MSAENERDEQQHDPRDFDAAFDRLNAQTDAPDDAPAEGDQGETPVAEAPPVEQPPPAVESDDDDEGLPLETRFERARRREERVKQEAEARLADLERHARDQKNGYEGRLKQEIARTKALEAERDDLDRQIKDVNARRDRDYEQAIEAAPDQDDGTGRITKTDLRRMWNTEKRERELAQKEERIALREKQEADEATRQKTENLNVGIQGMREHAMPDLIQTIEGVADQIGLPRAEIRHIAEHLRSEPVLLAIRHMPPEEIEPYRVRMFQRALPELKRVKDAYDERQAAQNRQEAAPAYRGEKPVGAGGGAGDYEDTTQYGTDFDAAFAANSRNHERALSRAR